ncbi:MAG: DUF4382 domain-containing protein [Candidatus Aminicenantes bacterium]|nr:DUF4382 domain-containing protein [Candidatus Aminicenantes bacterium]
MKNSRYLLLVIVFVISLLFGFNCNTGTELSNSGSMDSEFTESDLNSGTLNFFMTASGASGSAIISKGEISLKEDIRSLIVTITELEVHRISDGDAGWKVLPLSGDSFDLIELDRLMWADLLSSTNPEKGEYNKIRLNLLKAIVTTESGTYDVEVPGDKIKINLPFSVHEDATTEVTISVDPKSSLKSTGNKDNPKYFLNPVLKVSTIIED